MFIAFYKLYSLHTLIHFNFGNYAVSRVILTLVVSRQKKFLIPELTFCLGLVVNVVRNF